MKIALLGYGKMGKEIEKISLERGHSISIIVDKDDSISKLKNSDVAINFSTPDSAVNNIKLSLDSSVPAISGTTGWLEYYNDIMEYSKKSNTSFMYSSNYSLGVNLFFEMNKHLAKLMNDKTDYVASITEIHHTHKIGSPSGTAVTLAKDLISNHPSYSSWKLTGQSENMEKSDLPISAIREENVPGTHLISYTSEIDTLTIEHQAHNRKGFALGAVIAAEFIHKKQGVYTMSDILKF